MILRSNFGLCIQSRCDVLLVLVLPNWYAKFGEEQGSLLLWTAICSRLRLLRAYRQCTGLVGGWTASWTEVCIVFPSCGQHSPL
jgi:hypothetical protein